MRTFLKFSLWSLFVLLLLSLVLSGLVVGLAHEGWTNGNDWRLIVDGEELFNASGGFDDAGGAFGLFIGLALAALCLFIVVPLVLVLGVGLPMLAVLCALAGVVVALLGVFAALAAPLLLPLLLVVWLIRRDRRPHPAST